MKLWGGRFATATDEAVERFTHSLAFDQRLATYDLRGSIAHVKTLVKAHVLTRREGTQLVRALTLLLSQAERGVIDLNPHAEDVHTAIHELLERQVGEVARKLHTARSRNDQVALDLRLYGKAEILHVETQITHVQRALVRLAKAHQEVLIPGYTHLQRAQVVSLAHQLLAYVEMLQRDRDRLQDACVRVDVLPTGSAALAGTAIPLDRQYQAKLLGFSRVSDNSMDAVSDRDFVVELLAALAILGMHCSRIAEDWILWCSMEFGLLELPDRFATGSSAMPHKKNPDVLELIRGSTGALYGDLIAVLTILKGLPLTYNRDLQHDKRALFEACDLTRQNLAILERLIPHLRVRREQAARLVSDPRLMATELAEQLVSNGMAFQEAHRAVGELVRLAEQQGRALTDWSLAELQQIAPAIDEEAVQLFDPLRAVQMKQSSGSTNPVLVQRAIARWERALGTR